MVPSEGTVCAEISDRQAAGRAALLDQHGRRASSASVLSAFWHKYDEAIDDDTLHQFSHPSVKEAGGSTGSVDGKVGQLDQTDRLPPRG